MIDRSRETSQIWAYLDALCREDVKRDLYSFSQEEKWQWVCSTYSHSFLRDGHKSLFYCRNLTEKRNDNHTQIQSWWNIGCPILKFLISLLSFSVINYAVCEIKIKWIFKLLKWPSPKYLESGLRHRPNLWLSPFVSQPRNPCSGSPHMPWLLVC